MLEFLGAGAPLEMPEHHPHLKSHRLGDAICRIAGDCPLEESRGTNVAPQCNATQLTSLFRRKEVLQVLGGRFIFQSLALGRRELDWRVHPPRRPENACFDFSFFLVAGSQHVC